MLKYLLLILLISTTTAFARDDGQWEHTDPVIVEWYKTLKQPDVPAASCCGEADAYYCQSFVKQEKTYCRITDDRDDEIRHRPHVDIGTIIEIPDNKLKWDEGNPTGHEIVFLSRNQYVFCFVQNGGT